MPHREKTDLAAPEIDDSEDIYAVLGVEKSATAEEIKKAYRKLALRLHPDKIPTDASEEERAEQTAKFQRLALYYAILTDETKRARYDSTGSVSEASSSILDGFASSGREWDEYFEELYGGIVTIDKIEEFAKEYRGSEEEKKDLIEIYNDKQGDMDEIMENLMLADTENEPRLRTLIESLFSASLLTPTPLWKKTTTKSAIKKRTQEAHTEAKEAEQHAKELGLHDKLSKASGKTDEEKLMALIKANSERRMGALISNLEAKYAKPAKKGKGKKAREEESEEENVEEEVVEVKKKAKKAKA